MVGFAGSAMQVVGRMTMRGLVVNVAGAVWACGLGGRVALSVAEMGFLVLVDGIGGLSVEKLCRGGEGGVRGAGVAAIACISGKVGSRLDVEAG